MPNVLQEIGAKVQLRLNHRKKEFPLEELKARSASSRKPHAFSAAFQETQKCNVIAEIKRASPSRPEIAMSLDPVDVARDYLNAGAAALSVLTEPDFFKGDIEFLRSIRKQHPNALLLMKDFFLEEYQLHEALLAGADAILIIMALCGKKRAKHLYQLASELGLTALIEVHNAEELDDALAFNPSLVGVNSRDLQTLQIREEVFMNLITKLSGKVTAIAESGIQSRSQMNGLMAKGYRGFLVGTSLMETGDPGRALEALLKE